MFGGQSLFVAGLCYKARNTASMRCASPFCLLQQEWSMTAGNLESRTLRFMATVLEKYAQNACCCKHNKTNQPAIMQVLRWNICLESSQQFAQYKAERISCESCYAKTVFSKHAG